MVLLVFCSQGSPADESDGLQANTGWLWEARPGHTQLLWAVPQDLRRGPGAENIQSEFPAAQIPAQIGERERNGLFNDALNTFYGVRHMVKDHSDSEKGFFYMHHPIDRMTHTTAFVTPVVEHWLEREIAQWCPDWSARKKEWIVFILTHFIYSQWHQMWLQSI